MPRSKNKNSKNKSKKDQKKSIPKPTATTESETVDDFKPGTTIEFKNLLENVGPRKRIVGLDQCAQTA